MSGELSEILQRGRGWLRACRAMWSAAREHPACRYIARHLHCRRRTVAVVGSVLLHLLALTLLLSPLTRVGGLSSGGSVGDGMGAGEGVDLTLYDITQPAPSQMAVKSPEAEDLEELDELDVAMPVQETLAEVSETQLSDMASIKVVEVSATPSSTSETASEANRGATGTGGLTKGQGDDLWAAIAPCWKQIADGNTLPVKLEVTFSAKGALAEPPVIMRTEGMSSNQQVLTSESKAIQALAACGAYPMAAGQRQVAINFPAL